MKNNNQFCSYYVAQAVRDQCWLLSSLMRGTEHIAFDRALDKEKSIFEFFVPESTEHVFLQVIDYLLEKGILTSCEKKENRLELEI